MARGVSRRARLDGRGAGSRRRALGCADAARDRELPRSPGCRSTPSLVRALAMIKADAARVNSGFADVPQVSNVGRRTRSRPPPTMVAGGTFDEHFPIDVFQTGSGTSSNMNANEVIARPRVRARSVSRCTRTITSMRRSRRTTCSRRRCTSRSRSASTRSAAGMRVARTSHLRRKQRDFAKVVKSGRTHLMDATPVTLGQEFGGYATQIEDGIARLRDTLPRVCALPLGGTAVGTGINAPKRFAGLVIQRLAARTGLPLTEATRPLRRARCARRARRDAAVSSARSPCRCSRSQTTSGWMGSGPRTGLAEIRLPDLQPGSSIMPGKVNPVIPEVVTQVVVQVIGQRHRRRLRGLAGPLRAQRVRAGDRAQPARIDPASQLGVCSVRRRVASTASKPTSSAPGRTPSRRRRSVPRSIRYLGYEVAAEIVKEATKTGRSVRDVVKRRKLMTDDELDHALDVDRA